MKCKLFFSFIIFPCVISSQTITDGRELKREALEFLLNNMDGLYSLSGDNIGNYYKYMNSVFESTDTLTNDQYREAYRHALHLYPFIPENCDTVFDSQHVTPDYLESNIDSAYEMWQRNSHHVSFDTFCDFILPYRIGCEPLSDWRSIYKKEYGSKVSPYLSRQYNYYHLFSIHNMLNQGFNGAVYYPNSPLPEFSLEDLLKVKIGCCESYSARGVAQLRAFGIPATIDFVPQWGNRSMGHSWGVMFLNDTRTLPFGLNEPLGSHFDERPELTMPKVYRLTFRKQDCMKEICEDPNPNIPQIFRSRRCIDVTDTYVETSDVTIPVQDSRWLKNVKWIYLAVFNNRDWIPVAYAPITGSKAVFSKMGRGIMYIPFYFDEFGRRHYVTSPFLIANTGEVRYMSADSKQTCDITVTRKYWESETLKKYNRQLEGGKIVVSNTEDFRDSVSVAVIDTINGNRFYTIPLNCSGKYRFVKYLSPKNSFGNVAEIQLYDERDSIVVPVRCFGGRGAWEEHSPEKAFDGNELTSYSRISPNGGWAAAELEAPVHLTKIRIHPRTDGNAIYAGDVYQLQYWDKGKWNIVSECIARQQDEIRFSGVPGNALLLLHNVSRGKEERIFTYENGCQVWW